MCVGKGFLLVFSITSRASYEKLLPKRENYDGAEFSGVSNGCCWICPRLLYIAESTFNDLPDMKDQIFMSKKILVGNKCGLRNERIITTEMAKKFGARFVEASAKIIYWKMIERFLI